MSVQKYTSRVLHIVSELQREKAECPEDFRFSDIYDAEGNQYVNLVQEGGGVLGIALVGFTYVLEEMGIRFLSMGGTSAGSINTLVMADIGRPHEAKSLKVLELIADKNFMDFVDGGNDARQLVRGLGSGNRLALASGMVRNLDDLYQRWGMNPGREFQDWLTENLQHKTWESLNAHIRDLAEDLTLMDNHGNETHTVSADDLDIKIAIVAADVTTQTKVDFPDMADLYYENPLVQNPAEFVRASMSIPFFFEPHRVDMSWAQRQEVVVRDKWTRRANYRGPLPEEVLFVDGGVMSNFPIDLFHAEDRIPNRPTFGVKLGMDRQHYYETRNIASFANNIFEGVRNLRDNEFMIKNPEYRELIENIDVQGFNWVDFNISEEDKLALFERGAQAAAHFLRRFDWRDYKDHIRHSLLQAVKPLMWELSGTHSMEEKLKAFGIDAELPEDQELLARIEYLQNSRSEPGRNYHVLWIDDAFTYGLPVAILDSLNIYTYTVQNSDDARTLLNHKNRKGAPPEERIDLIISDCSRFDDGEKDRIAGIRFAAELAAHGRLNEVPVILYAHTARDARERYRKYMGDPSVRLPPNIKNVEDENTVGHKVFIREVVNNIFEHLHQEA